jgi:hypothetical protein
VRPTKLFEDASLSERVDQLPFRPGETVLSVGDSFTDDLQTCLETTRCVKNFFGGTENGKVPIPLTAVLPSSIFMVCPR